MINAVKKIFMVVALVATIFSATSANAASANEPQPIISTLKVDAFVAELQKNLADKRLQVNDLHRTPDFDIKDYGSLAWNAVLAPKGGTSGDSISIFTNKDNQVLMLAIKIHDGATQQITYDNFWEAALVTLNFTADERTQFLKGGTVDDKGNYSSNVQRSETEKFFFISGKSNENTLFAFLTLVDE